MASPASSSAPSLVTWWCSRSRTRPARGGVFEASRRCRTVFAIGVAVMVAVAGSARAEQPVEADTATGAQAAAPAPPPGPGDARRPVPAVPAPEAIAPNAAVDAPAVPSASFAREPFTLATGSGEHRWAVTFYGFVEADAIVDSTRSYNDAIGGALVARSDTYEGRTGRSQFSVRNTRLGLAFESPAVGGVSPSAVLEGDFFGGTAAPTAVSESTFYTSPTFRVRHAYLKLHNDYVDVLAGQTYDVFGWQNDFFSCSAEFLGLPNQVFSRNPQLRLSHAFNPDGAVTVEVAASAVRPAQRDGSTPDANAGLRIAVNGWKGISTPGNVGTTAVPLSIGLSAVSRRFKVNAFAPPPTQASNAVSGWGVSADVLLPVIPARNANDRGNRLTLTGSFVIGTGIADLLTTGGGAAFPTLPNPAQANPPPLYTPDIDDGLVSFDTVGVLHTIDWRALRAGLQYYLPPAGRLIFAANFTQAHSKNIARLFPRGGAEIELLGSVADTSLYADANLFWDATPAARLGVSGQYTQVQYLDGNRPHNLRTMLQAVYIF